MPTYENTTSKKIYIDGRYVLPDETIETTVYVSMEGFDLISHEPYLPNAVLYCEDIEIAASDEEIVEIPHPVANELYYLTVAFLDNDFLLYIDMNPNAIGLFINQDTYYNELLNWQKHAYIRVVNESNTKVAKARVIATSY